LELPTVNGQPERIASSTEAAALLEVLPVGDRSLVGDRLLRRAAPGKLQALH
jgi:hypothetical protein